MDIFSERLRDVRQLSAQTQKNVAKNIEMSARRYNDLENKKFAPSADTLVKLCKYFNVSSDYFLGLSDEKNYLKVN